MDSEHIEIVVRNPATLVWHGLGLLWLLHAAVEDVGWRYHWRGCGQRFDLLIGLKHVRVPAVLPQQVFHVALLNVAL